MRLERIKEVFEQEIGILDKYTMLYTELIKTKNEKSYLSIQEIVEYSDKEFGFEENDLDNQEKREIALVGLKYYPLLRETIRILAQSNDCSEQFYQKLQKAVFESELFPLDDRQFGAILFILSNQVQEIPYYQVLNTLTMSNEEFSDAVNEIGTEVRKGIYMMKYRTNTLTEQASQLYDIADSLGNREKAIVFWAAILGELKADYEDDEAE